MRVVLQRVSSASVRVHGEGVAAIGRGLLALVGAGGEDSEADASTLARKTAELRIFEDDEGKMNRSLLDVNGGLLAVSQFTLYADCRKGRRPSFGGAMKPDEAERLIRHFAAQARASGVDPVGEGRFGAMMEVVLVNDGPVTIVLESRGGRLC